MLRLSQMTEKTNQFNFNKISYSEMGLKTYIKNGNYIISYSSADKFGDYGIIGLALLEIKENSVIIVPDIELTLAIHDVILDDQINFEYHLPRQKKDNTNNES